MVFGAVGVFFLIWLILFLSGIAGLAFTVYSLVDVVRAPDAAFGPPWDNCKNAWTLGIALAFAIPFAVFVVPIVWWNSGHAALRRGERVPRPFWASQPSYPYPPQPPYQQPYEQQQPPQQ